MPIKLQTQHELQEFYLKLTCSQRTTPRQAEWLVWQRYQYDGLH